MNDTSTSSATTSRVASHLRDDQESPNLRLAGTAEAGPTFGPRLCQTPLFERYVQALLCGDRPRCREIVSKAADCGVSPRTLLLDLCWPAMEHVRDLYRTHQISLVAQHLASRLNRATVDRVCGNLPMKAPNGRKVLLACGDSEPEELGGQITADLFEAEGYEVKFVGGGVPNDEVLHLLGMWRPDLLVLFATLARDMPATRRLIDYLRDHNTHPQLQVMCCGGIYRRAEGLADEVGADLVATDADDAVTTALENPGRRATSQQQTVGKNRRLRRVAEEQGRRKAA